MGLKHPFWVSGNKGKIGFESNQGGIETSLLGQQRNIAHKGLNRTKVGLKQNWAQEKVDREIGLNRTKVGLKRA